MTEQSLFHKIHQDDASDKLSLIVEISKGDCNKYEFNHELGVLELDRVLYGPLVYPINYCDVPGTWNDGDGDPLDALLFNSAPLQPGALVIGRVVGMMEMNDNGELDNKIICVSDRDPRYAHVKDVKELTPYEIKDLKTFFELYKVAQTGRDSVKVGEFLGKAAAAEFIQKCTDAYAKKFPAT
jgi:inorganic pyrophosphatase